MNSGLSLEGTRLRSMLAALVAVSLALVAFAAAGPAAASTGALSPPHADAGLDTDVPPDGYYNYLVLTVNVVVTGAGGFVVFTNLYDGLGITQISSVFRIVNLQTGANAVEVRFPGYEIRRSGIDGPYIAQIILLNDTFAFVDIGVHPTAAYFAVDFQPPPTMFAPPHSDFGVDLDGDLQFDYLAIDVSVAIAVGGEYTVTSTLTDSPPTTFIGSASNRTVLSPGTATVRLTYSGPDIRAAGVNGPYQADFNLVGADGRTIDSGSHTTSLYFLSDFDAPGARFAPPHFSFVEDLDGDLFYDFLVLNVLVDVTEAGQYTVTADAPGLGLFSVRSVLLPAGVHLVQLTFLGVDIFNSAVDGPYTIDLGLRDDSYRLIDQDSHTTAAYFAADFEPSPPVRWVPPTSDFGQDDQPDGTWDFLVVDATITADRPGDYSWSFEVWDQTFVTFITSASGEVALATGDNPVRMRAPGLEIWRAGIDGPYGIQMYLYDESGSFLDQAAYTTGAYLATDFDPPPGSLTPPYVDLPLDRSTPPDGTMDVLAVDVPVTVTTAGTFVVTGTLIGSGFAFFAFAQTLVDLSPGLTTVRLMFPATNAFVGGEGAFLCGLSLGVVKGGRIISIDNDVFFTRNYTAAPFDQGPATRLSGHVTAASSGRALASASVIAWSSTLRLAAQATTDASGYYELNLPAGDWVVVADATSWNAAGTVVTLAAATVQDFRLDPPPADAIVASITFATWDTAAFQGDITLAADVVGLRFELDAGFGDGDGFLSQTELDRILVLAQDTPIPYSTRDMFTVDGVEYRRVNGTESFTLSGAGSVVSNAPIRATVTADFTSASPIPITPRHDVVLREDFDTISEQQDFRVTWPSGFVMTSFLADPGITVTGIGGPTAQVDPGVDPTPRDFVHDGLAFLTVSTTDTSPPIVTGTALDGQSTLRTRPGPTVAVTATASDAGRGDWAIGGANFTVGAGNWPGTAMAAADGTFDGVTEDVSGTLATASLAGGSYSICVYAWDVVPNGDTTGSCAVLIVDDTAPSVTNVRVDGAATRTVVVGTTVTLTATASDAGRGDSPIAEANYTVGAAAWPGTAMAAVDGSFDEATEDISVSVSTVGWTPGTYELCVYAKDGVGNDDESATVCAQLVVIDQDVTPPTISGPRADPNPANVSVAVNLSAVATDDIGVTAVYFEVLDGQGTLVENLTATYDPVSGRWYVQRPFATGGSYSFRVWARDAEGNWATATGTFAIRSPPGDGSPAGDYLWIIVLIAVVAAVAILVLLWMRRRKPAAPVAPAPPSPQAPPPAQAPPAPPAAPAQPPPPPSDEFEPLDEGAPPSPPQ